MPGGLAAWLDDPIDTKLKPKSEKSVLQPEKLHPCAEACEATAAAAAPPSAPTARQPVTAIETGSTNFPIIDVDAVTPCESAAGPGKTTRLVSSNTSKTASALLWDPFTSEERHAHQDDAFVRLLQGRPSFKLKGVRSAGVSPSLSNGGSSGSTWDPFASSGEGKENGGDNAFSRLLASPGQGASGKGRGVLFKGARSSAGKRKRPAGSSPNGSSAPAGAEEDAMTRFCDCPVCGKRVIIELCSKHLDEECYGSDTMTDLSTSPPPARTERPEQTPSTPCGSTAACAPSRLLTTRQPEETSSPLPPPRIGGVKRKTSSGIEQEGKDGHAMPTPAVTSPPLVDTLCGAGTPTGEGDEKSRKKARSAEAGRSTSSSPAPTSANSGSLELAVSRRKTARSPAGAAVAAADLSEAVISCPVCGQKVRADLCSRHLDTDCAGISPADPSVVGRSEGEGSKNERGGGSEKGDEGGEASDRVAAEAKRDKETSETAGGLTALGAELTCPVCLCVFEDAHTLPCSHRFCLECITGCFRSSKRQECPLCKVPAWKRDLKRDIPLQNIIIAYRRMI